MSINNDITSTILISHFPQRITNDVAFSMQDVELRFTVDHLNFHSAGYRITFVNGFLIGRHYVSWVSHVLD
ncbi:hypothetical protein D3C78_1499180 [compost metagenome]